MCHITLFLFYKSYQYLQIVSVKTEDSVVQEVSERIEHAAKSHSQSVDCSRENNAELNTKENEDTDSKLTYRANLQKQVEIGEITPFEAASKQSALEQKEGYYKLYGF